MATTPDALNLSQYNFELGDTTDVITKDNARNSALDTFGSQLNQMVIEIANEQQQTIDVAGGHATDAGNSATAAGNSATLAGKWAAEAEDVEVTTGEYSAYHWAQKAQAIAVGNVTVVDLQPGTGTTGQVVTVNGSGDLAWDDILWEWLTNVPATATRWPAWDEVTDKPTFASVATTGSYNDLSDKPTLFSGSYNDLSDTPAAPGEMAALNRASSSQIRSMTGDAGVTSDRLSDAAAFVSYSHYWSPNWAAFISAEWSISSSHTLGNPSSVIPGTTRVVKVRSSSSTSCTVSFGSAYKGAPASLSVTNTNVALLTLFAVSSSEIVVSSVEYSV